jgi:hypothetical protein
MGSPEWRALMPLELPYGVMPDDEEMPFSDFNKEILAPGLLLEYPDGAIGVRVDGDFYSIASLPYDKYLNVPIQDIVKEFWPSKFDGADFGEDSVTTADEIKIVEAFEAHRKKHSTDTGRVT